MRSLNLIMTFMAVITLGIGVYISKINTQEFMPKTADAPSVLSETTDEKSPTPQASVSPTPAPSTASTPKATPLKTPSPTPQKQNTPSQPSQTSLSEFIYPSASVISQSQTTLSLTSNDNPNTITNWYKDKFASLKMPARSVASTNTNGNILTKLAGAKNDFEVQVEIKKDAGSETVKINVNLD